MAEAKQEIDKFQPKDELIYEADPLSLSVKDSDLVKVINKRLDTSKKFYTDEKNLYERQKKNEDYIMGRQINEEELKDHNARYMDNVIFEALASLKPIAMSRLPDLIVKPGNDTPESKKTAKSVSKVLDADNKQRSNRRVLGLAYKHVPTYFAGVIKYRWDPEMEDIRFEVVNPKNFIMDHTASGNNTDDHEYDAELLELSIKELVMRFPDKEAEIYLETKINTADGDNKNEKKMASKVKIWEVWFTWYEKGEGNRYKRVEGVCWKYKNLLLKKMKNPNWDWSGEDKYFVYDTAKKEKRPAAGDEVKQALLGAVGNTTPTMAPFNQPQWGSQMPVETEKVFHNHFANPKKPYIVIGYDQWGMMPYDETSWIEQNIFKQDNVNKRGKQITETADRIRGKDIFSTASGLTKEGIENLDMSDPDTDLLVNGNVNDSYAHIEGAQLKPSLFQDQAMNRDRMFATAGVHSTTRGQKETHVATTSQILREADFGRADDVTEDTINYASEEMANARMQLMKMRYTEDHMKRILGKDGNITFQKINRNMIEDGMEVVVSSSGVDKTMRKREAFERAKMQLTDPLTFFEDTDAPNPKERTERLLLFMKAPELYLKQVVEGQGTADMAQALQGQPVPGQGMPPTGAPPGQPPPVGQPGGTQGEQQAIIDIAMMQQGQMPQVPQQLDQEYLQTIEAFVKSPDFAQLPPQIQQQVVQFAQQLVQMAQGAGQQ